MPKSKNRSLVIFGTFSIILGASLLGYRIYEHYQNKYLNQRLIDEFFNDSSKSVDEMHINNNHRTTTFANSSNHYMMVLEIPRIKLKKGIYKMNSKYNHVKYGIEILKQSSMPYLEKSNLILASHSGNSKVSYFNNLYKLSNDDIVYIYYEKIKYIYKIVNIYEIIKGSKVYIYNDNSISMITLITCKKNENKQLIFIGNLIRKEKY